MVDATTASPAPLLRMDRISRAFAGIQALREVSLEVMPGEVLGLVGENGAGKSTLMRILNGAVTPDAGEIIWRGAPVHFTTPLQALSAGIAMIHQELSLVPSVSVAANIFLGHELRTPLGLLDLASMERRADELMRELDTPLDVTRPAEQYSIATQQMVEVAKVLSHNASLIVMDEPTSALADAEVERLFAVIRSLRDRGVAIVYISHKLEEIYNLCDRVTVLRDGAHIATSALTDLPTEELIRWMVGRHIDQLFPHHQAVPGEQVLEARHVSLPASDGTDRRLVDDVSLALRAGEIVGLAGLRGSGASELMGCLFGQFGRRAGAGIIMHGRPVRVLSPADAIRAGLAMLTNDRKATGLVLPMSVLHNMTLASLPTIAPHGVLHRSAEVARAQPLAEALALRAASLDVEVNALSGGNQQKVALAKWLMTGPQVLLLDEPTRGIDVGAKAEVYQLMNDLVAQGKAILLTTSELPELLAMSDRILVMHRGHLTAEIAREDATQESVMAAAVGAT